MTEVNHVIELRRDAISRGLVLNELWMPDARAAKVALEQWQVSQFILESNQGDMVIVNPTPARVSALIVIASRHGGPDGEVSALLNVTANRCDIASGGQVYWSRFWPEGEGRVTLGHWLGENGF